VLKTLSRALAALAMLFAPAAYAQTRDADPALWVVKDADTTIYLFGSFHALKPGVVWFDDAVKTAFDKSDQLMLEMVEPDAATLQGMVVRMALNPNGPTVTEQLPADKRDAYTKAMTEAGVPPAMFDRFDPWLPAIAMTTASAARLGYDPALGVEKTLTAEANAAHKPIAGLETAEQQLGYFDGLPAPLQIKYLVSTIDDMDQMGPMLDKMVGEWSAGDPDALGRDMNESLRETPELGKVLLTERNARWAEWIEKRMAEPGTVFIAVGAGHLAGPDSVQAFLAKRNLKAERVVH
jgi:uncharacterized protein YbaP (TraB family)